MTNLERYWQNTFSGVKFTPFTPEKEQIFISDIAHALSNLCRYCGHCEKFYSVAEHSVHTAQVVKLLGGSLQDQQWALLHDATEAYLADLPKPVKVHPALSLYCETEDTLMAVIAERFGLPSTMPEVVKRADVFMLAIESDVLIPRKPQSWNLPLVPGHVWGRISIKGYAPTKGRDLFLSKFYELFSEEKPAATTSWVSRAFNRFLKIFH